MTVTPVQNNESQPVPQSGQVQPQEPVQVAENTAAHDTVAPIPKVPANREEHFQNDRSLIAKLIAPFSKTKKSPPVDGGSSQPKKARSFAGITFAVIVIFPLIATIFYYSFVASDQYRSEARFAIRGTESSPFASLGLSVLPGNSSKTADAYIVNEYIRSYQILIDLKEQYGVDVRQLYAWDDIDPVFRIDADMPLEKFLRYWNFMIDCDFNSTTGITTFRVNAFSGQDAGKVSTSVVQAAAQLVNTLSSKARKQLISSAQSEVKRTEDRLTLARSAVEHFRNKQQSIDPSLRAKSESELLQNLQKQLIDLKTRQAALLSTVSRDSPSARVLERQIVALNREYIRQQKAFGSGGTQGGVTNNLSVQMNEYSRLVLEEEFAAKAYTAALSSLETSQAEARKSARYFAIIVEPTTPKVSLFPNRVVNPIIICAILLIIWLFIYLGIQSVRDHSV